MKNLVRITLTLALMCAAHTADAREHNKHIPGTWTVTNNTNQTITFWYMQKPNVPGKLYIQAGDTVKNIPHSGKKFQYSSNDEARTYRGETSAQHITIYQDTLNTELTYSADNL